MSELPFQRSATLGTRLSMTHHAQHALHTRHGSHFKHERENRTNCAGEVGGPVGIGISIRTCQVRCRFTGGGKSYLFAAVRGRGL